MSADAGQRRASILIAAAGQGDRLGRGPKGRLALNGRWLAQWVYEIAHEASDDVIVAIPPTDDFADWQMRLPGARIVRGGATRFASLKAMLDVAREPFLLLADAARPFITRALLDAVFTQAAPDTVGAAAIPLSTPIADVNAVGEVIAMHSNVSQFTMETPIALHRDVLMHALSVVGKHDRHLSEVIARLGYRIRVTPCARDNIKITHPEHWPLAQAIAARWHKH